MRNLTVVIALVVGITHCSTSNRGVDTQFGTSGKTTLDFSGGDDDIVALAATGAGLLIAGGTSYNGIQARFALARFTEAGLLDTSFGTAGMTTTNFSSGSSDTVRAMAVQSDGKIILVGESVSGATKHMAVARYTENGALDTSFDADGLWTRLVGVSSDSLGAVAIDADGNLILGGKSLVGNNHYGVVIRTDSTGAVDDAFGTNGVQLLNPSGADSEINALRILSSGKIIAAGKTKTTSEDLAAWRLDDDGAIDLTFGDQGIFIGDAGTLLGGEKQKSNESLSQLLIDNSENLYLVGTTNYSGMDQFMALRIRSDGTKDTRFGTNGLVLQGFTYTDSEHVTHTLQARAYGAVLDNTYAPFVVGNAGDLPVSEMAVARFMRTGQLDRSVGRSGELLVDFNSKQDEAKTVLWKSDGKLVIGGKTLTTTGWDFALVRVIP